MSITLKIENFDQLEDGGPLQFSSQTGFEVGRDSSMQWTLPDPNRFISGRHFEISKRGHDYILKDLSTNGTFLFGSNARLQSSHILQNGERLQVGPYIIAVTIENITAAASSTTSENLWDVGGAASDPIDLSPKKKADAFSPGDFSSEFIQSVPAAPTPDTGAASPFGAPAPQTAPTPAVQPPQSVRGPSSEAFLEPEPVKPSVPQPTTPAAPAVSSSDFLAAVCRGAGISENSVSDLDQTVLAEQIGQSLRVAADSAIALLRARAATKQFVKSGSRTMIGAQENNPLKFMPTTEEALEVMLSGKRAGYLDSVGSLVEAFEDIKTHQAAVYSAIQPALARLLEDLSPEAIENRSKSSSLVSNKRGRNWDVFVERWDAKTAPYDNGMLDVFLKYFSDAYDQATNKVGE